MKHKNVHDTVGNWDGENFGRDLYALLLSVYNITRPRDMYNGDPGYECVGNAPIGIWCDI